MLSDAGASAAPDPGWPNATRAGQPAKARPFRIVRVVIQRLRRSLTISTDEELDSKLFGKFRSKYGQINAKASVTFDEIESRYRTDGQLY